MNVYQNLRDDKDLFIKKKNIEQLYPDMDAEESLPYYLYCLDIPYIRKVFFHNKRPWNFEPEGFKEKVSELNEEKEISLVEFTDLIDSAGVDKEQMVNLSERMHAYKVLQSLMNYVFPFCIAVWGCTQTYLSGSISVPICLAILSL